MSKKTILFVFGAILVAGAVYTSWYSFARNQVIVHNPAPINNIPCDQSATTTPCSELIALQNAPDSTPAPVEPIEPFVFGKLTKTYTDKVSGFSFRYPDELTLVQPVEPDSGCPYLVTGPDPKSSFLSTSAPSCFTSTDPEFTSFDDFKKEYTVIGVDETKFVMRFLTSEPIKTKSGISGVHQVFSVNAEEPLDSGEIVTTNRNEKYIFKLPQKGFLVFSRFFSSVDTLSYYGPLDRAIMESVVFH